MPASPLVPASLSFVDGVPYAETFGDVYHSSDGGMDQAHHVFLGGNGLPERWRGRSRFTILETGFGLGLNFLTTWLAWRADPARSHQLHYVAIEKHPFSAADLAQLHAIWPALAEVSASLRAAWPPLVSGFHRILLDDERVVLTLVFGDIAECLPQVDAAADAFYLDGFAPSKNPDMWSPAILARLNRFAAPGATVATYTVSAAVRKALAQAGFACEKRPGFGRKRDMLAARYAPRWQPIARPAPAVRSAIVIGAGVAGCAACERLAARGWQVTLIDRHGGPAQEASGNRAGIVMPLLSQDDNLSSRLARAAFLFATRLWDPLGGIGTGFAGEACGVLQVARDADHAELQRAAIAPFRHAEDFVRWLDGAEVARLTGNPASHGGWLFPRGAWVTPSSLCEAMLRACGERLTRRFSREAARLERTATGWSVLDDEGVAIAEAPVVIVASGIHATRFAQAEALPLSAIRGQVTHVPASMLPEVPVVLCGEGYVTRPAGSICCVGASYDMDDDPQLRRSSHEENLQRLRQVLPHLGAGTVDAPLDGRVGFRCVSPDRLPLVGALPEPGATIGGSRLRDVPRLPGLHALLAYGSRGMIWAPLAAELLASQLEGEPLPIGQDLVAALDPARFALKAYRQQR